MDVDWCLCALGEGFGVLPGFGRDPFKPDGAVHYYTETIPIIAQ